MHSHRSLAHRPGEQIDHVGGQIVRQIAVDHVHRTIHAQTAGRIPEHTLQWIADQMLNGQPDELVPGDRILFAGHTVVHLDVVADVFAGRRTPGGHNHQIDDDIDGHHVHDKVRLADDRAIDAVADRRNDAGRTVPIVQPAGRWLL